MLELRGGGGGKLSIYKESAQNTFMQADMEKAFFTEVNGNSVRACMPSGDLAPGPSD